MMNCGIWNLFEKCSILTIGENDTKMKEECKKFKILLYFVLWMDSKKMVMTFHEYRKSSCVLNYSIKWLKKFYKFLANISKNKCQFFR